MLKDRLKKAREERGLSQAELAEALDLSLGGIGGYENGSRIPKQEILDRLAEYFRMAPEDLRRGRQLSPDQYAAFCARISDAMDHTSPEDFEALGLSEKTMRNAIKQQNPIREDRAIELADALGTDISDLLVVDPESNLRVLIERKLNVSTTEQLQKYLTYIELVQKGEL